VATLGDKQRIVAYAAAKALQRVPYEDWQDEVLQADGLRNFLVGSAALLALEVDREVCLAVLDRCRQSMAGFVSDDDFLDLLRVMQLALKRGQISGDDVPELRTALADEYPSAEPRMNRELLRLVAYLQAGEVLPRLLDELHGKSPDVEKVHAALCARFITRGWTSAGRLELLAYYEEARELSGGHSFKGYIENVARDFATQLNPLERQAVLAEAERWPSAALAVLATLEDVPPELVPRLLELDQKLTGSESDAARRLQTGIIAVLSGSGSPEGMNYLREVFEQSPERRPDLAMGLAQQPDGPNWPLLVRSLSAIEGGAAQEVLTQLLSAKQTSTDPQTIRLVIISGLRLKDEGGTQAAKLLNHWVGKEVTAPDLAWDKALERWQEWFKEQFPDELPAELPVEPEGSKWTLQELLTYLDTAEAKHIDAARGRLAFEKAQCVKCHRYAARGESIGPDLSTVGQRFQKKEILESILFPSLVISDQYAAKTVTTTSGKTYTGIVGAAGSDAIVVLQPNGIKSTVKKSDIEQTEPSRRSAMPEGLLDRLTLEEIGELFAYLTQQPSQVTRKPR
jgi:putative heme-binding domain-containing protein